MKRNNLIKAFKKFIYIFIRELDPQVGAGKGNGIKGRPYAHSVSYYLKYIFKVLFHGQKWVDLDCTCDESVIRKKFYKWSNLGIFHYAHKYLLEQYSAHKGSIDTLMIDSTVIQNQNSNELVDFGFKFKGKKCRKITSICTEDRVVISCVVTASSEHDINALKPAVTQIDIDMGNTYHTPTYLLGDKGYISQKDKTDLEKDNIILLTPYKRNQKDNNGKRRTLTANQKLLMKKRVIVEHTFSHLKRSYKRLESVYDVRLVNYISFLEMGLTCQLIRFFTGHKKMKKCSNETLIKYFVQMQ